ncbi:hypothetical protein J3Q64DRAFT_1849100 [Phycomyces blakesleeanus]|uniref:Uncharacterized protein n=1 Tax=Phycomyces blakesleeanus TaxID=4837 RepID=A0ABR3AZY6_PHYBL
MYSIKTENEDARNNIISLPQLAKCLETKYFWGLYLMFDFDCYQHIYGIGIALGSIYKSYYGDEILNIDQYKPFLERYDRERKEEEEIDKAKTKSNEIVQDTTNAVSPGSTETDFSEYSSTALPDSIKTASPGPISTTLPDIIKINLPDYIEIDSPDSIKTASMSSLSLRLADLIALENNFKDTEVDNGFSKVAHLRDRLEQDAGVEYGKKLSNNSLEEKSNAAYLAAFLHTMGPRRAKKIKHCILNGSITLGSNREPRCKNNAVYTSTAYLTVSGPGAACKFQYKFDLNDAEFMTDDMINSLETAHNIDDTPYIEIFITIVQLFLRRLNA